MISVAGIGERRVKKNMRGGGGCWLQGKRCDPVSNMLHHMKKGVECGSTPSTVAAFGSAWHFISPVLNWTFRGFYKNILVFILEMEDKSMFSEKKCFRLDKVLSKWMILHVL